MHTVAAGSVSAVAAQLEVTVGSDLTVNPERSTAFVGLPLQLS